MLDVCPYIAQQVLVSAYEPHLHVSNR